MNSLFTSLLVFSFLFNRILRLNMENEVQTLKNIEP